MPAKSPPKTASPKTAGFAPRFAYGHMAEAAAFTGPEDGTRLGSGFSRMTGAEIPWTVRYDEVLVVLEGRLSVRTAQGEFSAGPQECIWLPAGTELTYVAENALVFYAIEPADWTEREGGAAAG